MGLNPRWLIDPLLQIIFPPICLHCREATELGKHLCKACSEHLSLLSLEGRCKRCLAQETGRCERCIDKKMPFRRLIAAFEYQGPAAVLLRAFKHSKRTEFAKDLAAFMAVQFIKADLPLPDLIVPVPQSLAHKVSRGFNQSYLLALELGKLLERPVYDVLKRRGGDFSQTGLTREQREAMSESAFAWKDQRGIADKTVLVVDDVMTTGTTLAHVGHVLEEGYPACLYAITCCVV